VFAEDARLGRRLRRALPFAVSVLVALPLGASAPPGQYDYGAGDGWATDVRTGLTWQQTPPSSLYAWADAQAYCRAQGARVPSVKELETLVDESTRNPALDRSTFFLGATPVVWTSSASAADTTLAWVVNLDLGVTGFSPLADQEAVLCVR